MNRDSRTLAVPSLLPVFLLIISCGLTLTEEESKFVRSSHGDQVDAILAAEPERQIELYILAMTRVFPHNVSAKYALAERGSEVLPFVLTRLDREPKDSNIQLLIQLLVTMQIMKYYCVACDENAMAIVHKAANRIGNTAVRSDTQSFVRNFLVPEIKRN